MAIATQNVVLGNGVAYSAAGAAGIVVHSLEVDADLVPVHHELPPAGMERVDDVAVAEGALFALDATHPGRLSSFSLQDPTRPRWLSGPLAVEVEPFSGVSAAGGRVVVSGGTSLLSVRQVAADGSLSEAVVWADLGLGQPDVLLHPSGKLAFVSTDFSGAPQNFVDGARFGLTVLALEDPTTPPRTLARLGIPGAGFTAGAAVPANFPLEGALAGDVLYLAHGGGLAVVAVADPAAPQLLHTIDLGFPALSATVDRTVGRLFVLGSSPRPQVAVLDVAEPSSPRRIDTVHLPSNAMPSGLAASEGYLAVADGRLGTRILRRA